jgi:hypothetical protein
MLHALYELLTVCDNQHFTAHRPEVEDKLVQLAHVLLFGRYSVEEFSSNLRDLATECRRQYRVLEEEDA